MSEDPVLAGWRSVPTTWGQGAAAAAQVWHPCFASFPLPGLASILSPRLAQAFLAGLPAFDYPPLWSVIHMTSRMILVGGLARTLALLR